MGGASILNSGKDSCCELTLEIKGTWEGDGLFRLKSGGLPDWRHDM